MGTLFNPLQVLVPYTCDQPVSSEGSAPESGLGRRPLSPGLPEVTRSRPTVPQRRLPGSPLRLTSHTCPRVHTDTCTHRHTHARTCTHWGGLLAERPGTRGLLV